MNGGTRKRGSTWSYYFDLGKVDGKRKKKEKGGFRTKKEAEQALAAALNEYHNAGMVFEPSEVTVSDYLDQWYELSCKPNLKYNTHVGYLRIIEGHLKPEAFALTWDDIDFEKKTLTVNKQIVKRNFGADVRKVVEQKGKREQRSSWYFTTPKTSSSLRTVPFGDTLYKALKSEYALQKQNEIKYGEFYTIHVQKKEVDEKGNDMIRIVPVQKCVESQLKRARLICIAENGQYTSTDSFKYCSRIIHNELQLAFDYHSLRHTHATMLIEAGANVKNVQTRLGHTNIQTTLQTYVHDTEKMGEQSVELFEQITAAKSS